MKKFYFLCVLVFSLMLNNTKAQNTVSCVAQFTASISGNTVSCGSSVIDSTALHYWNFGDGFTSSVMNPSHTYNVCGTYTITHLVQHRNPNSVIICADTVSQVVTIVCTSSCNLQAAFSTSASANVVTYTNTSTGFVVGDSIRWTFGDGSSSSSLSPTHTYTSSGTYNVCLRVRKNPTPTGAAPCISEVCHQITVTAPSVCNIVPSFSTQVSNNGANIITFTNTSSPQNSGAVVSWSFGDSTTGSGNQITHTYVSSGIYNVCMHIAVNNTCVGDTCFSINVAGPNPSPCNVHAAFNPAVSNNQSNIIECVNTSTVGTSGATYSVWNFGDGSPTVNASGLGNQVHTYAQAGTYTICLKVMVATTPGTVGLCSDSICHTITVTLPAPNPCNLVPHISAQPSPNQPNVFVFSNATVSNATGMTASWSFGDSTYGTGNQITHTYNSPGNYWVCLTVSTSNNCTADTCLLITVNGSNPQPCNITPSFTLHVSPNQSNVYTFTNTSSTIASAYVSWTFGDGTTGSGNSVTHNYTNSGNYLVCMNVSYGPSCVRDTCTTINVVVSTQNPCNLQANFIWQSTSNANANTVYFSNTTTAASSMDSVTWYFGDSSAPSHALNPIHTYTSPGTYLVCLRVVRYTTTGALPCVSDICHFVTIGSPSPAIICDSVQTSFTYVRDAFMPNKIYFVTISNYPVVHETWTISLLGSSSAPMVLNQYNPTYIFTQTGSYSLCLRAETAGGCIKEECDTVTINNIATQCFAVAYPNPAHTQVSTTAMLTAPSSINAFIYNSQNVLVAQQTISGATGNNPITFNISNLVAGYYTIRMYYNNQVCISRFQKL
jgi:PKD repeat protein